MTIRTYRTSETEAKAITDNYRRFILRDEKQHVKEGDRISFCVMKEGKPVLNKIDKHNYIVTSVINEMQAPIRKGFILIEFREV